MFTIGSTKTIVVGAVLIMVVAGLSWTAMPAVALTGFTANDISITTDDGELSELTVAPSGQVTWSGLEAEADTVSIRTTVFNDTTNIWTHDPIIDVTGTSGTLTFENAPVNVFNETETRHGSFSPADYTAADGSTASYSFDVWVQVYILDADNNVLANTKEVVTFDVTITNNETVVETSGTVDTTASD